MSRPIHVTHVLGNLGGGGAETGVLRLIAGLSDSSLRHSVTIAGSDRSLLQETGLNVPCHALGIQKRSYTAFFRFARLWRNLEVDVVHVNNLALWPDAALASRLSGCPCIETFHGIEDAQLAFSFSRRKLCQAAGLMSVRVTAVSEEAADLLVKLTGIDRRDVQVIPNGVDTQRFAPAETWEAKLALRSRKGLPRQGLLLGCVAALRPVKNHQGLLKAFERAVKISATPAFLVLVGDGPLLGDLKVLAHELGMGERVIFLGRRTDVDELLRCFDVFVLNSHTEGLSYALLEAMASGLPAVATAVGAAVQLIADGREGYLVPPGDEDALARVLMSLLKHPEVIFEMGLRARKTVEARYGIETMLERYRALYDETAGRSHA